MLTKFYSNSCVWLCVLDDFKFASIYEAIRKELLSSIHYSKAIQPEVNFHIHTLIHTCACRYIHICVCMHIYTCIYTYREDLNCRTRRGLRLYHYFSCSDDKHKQYIDGFFLSQAYQRQIQVS